MQFESGECVIVLLQNPREKLVGILDEITAAGISLRGIDLEYFEDWGRAIAAGEPHLAMNDCFYPMWRVERITRDQRDGEMPSMAEQFQAWTNRPLTEQ